MSDHHHGHDKFSPPPESEVGLMDVRDEVCGMGFDSKAAAESQERAGRPSALCEARGPRRVRARCESITAWRASARIQGPNGRSGRKVWRAR
jgi:hypothetical protein